MDLIRFGTSAFILMQLIGCLALNVEHLSSYDSPYLISAEGDLTSSLYINRQTDSANYTFKGKCFQTDPKGTLKVEVLNNDGSLKGTYPVTCVNNEFSFEADVQSWNEDSYKIKMTSTTEYGVSSYSTAEIIKDITPPDLKLPASFANLVNSAGPNPYSFSGACTTGDGDLNLQVNEIELHPVVCVNDLYNVIFDTSLLPQGDNSVLFSQTDRAGNKTEQSLSFFKDTLPPILPLAFSAPTQSLTKSTTAQTLSVTLPPEGTQYKYLIVKDDDCSLYYDEISAQSPVSTASISIPLDSGDGVYKACALAGDEHDNFQNASLIVSSGSITLDTLAPDFTISGAAQNSKHQSEVTIYGLCENQASVNISGPFVGSPSEATCSSSNFSFTLELLTPDGSKALQLSSTDPAGNTSVTKNWSVTKDTVLEMPTWTLAARPNNQTTAVFSISSCSDVTKVYISESSTKPALNHLLWQDCSTLNDYVYDLSAGSDGLRTLFTYFRDEAGNLSSIIEHNLLLDTKPPVIVIDTIPSPLPEVITTSLSFRLTEADIAASTHFYVEFFNGSTWSAVGSQALNKISPFSGEKFFYNWPVPSSIGTGRKIRIRISDNSGQSTTVESNAFEIVQDTTPPEITSASYLLNESSTPAATYSKIVTVAFEAIDTQTDITHYCIKETATQPLNSDMCWVSFSTFGIEPAKNLHPTQIKHDLVIPGSHRLYLWVRDRGLNISQLQGSPARGKDFVDIQYNIDAPPQVSKLLAANNLTPQAPPSWNDLTANPGQILHIAWHASDNTFIQNVQLLLVVDGEEAVVVSDGLANGLNAGCSAVPSGYTGCFGWSNSAPIGKSFILQLKVFDEFNQAASLRSAVFNSGPFRILAGNLDSGDGADPRLARFSPSYESNVSGVNQMATLTSGDILINDSRGLVKISPQESMTEVVLRNSDDSIPRGDGGNVKDALAGRVFKFTVDYLDNIWIMDVDRIRKIDTHTTPWTISSVIGADDAGNKGTSFADTILDPRNLRFETGLNAPFHHDQMIFTPNGDLYFRSTLYDSMTLRVYKGSLPQPRIETIRFSGALSWDWMGSPYSENATNMSFINWSVRFDPLSGAATSIILLLRRTVIGDIYSYPAEFGLNGQSIRAIAQPPYPNQSSVYYFVSAMDGQTYIYNRFTANRFLKLNHAAGTWDLIMGNDVHASSPDGSTASSSSVLLDTSFVNRFSNIYFVEKGIFRVVKNNQLYTVYGTSKNSPDQSPLESLKLNSISSIDHGKNDNVIIYDEGNYKFTEIQTNNQSYPSRHLAGNGIYTLPMTPGASSLTQGLTMSAYYTTPPFASDADTGDIYFGCHTNSNVSQLCYLNNTTRVWSAMNSSGHPIGTGKDIATYFDVPRDGNLVDYIFAYTGLVGGFAKTSGGTKKLLVGAMNFTYTADDGYHVESIKEVSGLPAGGAVKHLIGQASKFLGGNYTNGANAGTSHLRGGLRGMPRPQYVAATDEWYITSTSAFLSMALQPLTLIHKTKVGGTITEVRALDHAARSFYIHAGFVYSCDLTGEIRRTPMTGPAVSTKLNLPEGFRCSGNAMIFKNTGPQLPARIIFPIIYNGCQGIGEYKLE